MFARVHKEIFLFKFEKIACLLANFDFKFLLRCKLMCITNIDIHYAVIDLIAVIHFFAQGRFLFFDSDILNRRFLYLGQVDLVEK